MVTPPPKVAEQGREGSAIRVKEQQFNEQQREKEKEKKYVTNQSKNDVNGLSNTKN